MGYLGIYASTANRGFAEMLHGIRGPRFTLIGLVVLPPHRRSIFFSPNTSLWLMWFPLVHSINWEEAGWVGGGWSGGVGGWAHREEKWLLEKVNTKLWLIANHQETYFNGDAIEQSFIVTADMWCFFDKVRLNVERLVVGGSYIWGQAFPLRIIMKYTRRLDT